MENIQFANSQNSFKFVFVGNVTVGITSLLITYHEKGRFPTVYVPSVFDDFKVNITRDDETFEFSIWDTAGYEGYSRLRSLTYPKTDLFYICFSVVDYNSFEDVKKKWISEISYHKLTSTKIILVGTKTDLRNDQETLDNLAKDGKEPLIYEDGYNLAQEIGAIGYLECSSLTNEKYELIFEEGYNFCIEKKQNENNSSYNINDYRIPSCISRAKSARN